MGLFESYTDKQLLSLVSEGNEDAFNQIYERYWDKLLVYVMRVLQKQDEAQDIVQEIFISLWRRREVIEVENALSTYLFNSARYGTIKHIESNLNKSARLKKLTAYLQAPIIAQPPQVEEEIFERELSGKISQAIAMLPEKMREVFLLSRQHQLSYKEIALQLSISEETVKKQIYKALQSLRQHIDMPNLILLSTLIMHCIKKNM